MCTPPTSCPRWRCAAHGIVTRKTVATTEDKTLRLNPELPLPQHPLAPLPVEPRSFYVRGAFACLPTNVCSTDSFQRKLKWPCQQLANLLFIGTY